jgi:hypothetical protein
LCSLPAACFSDNDEYIIIDAGLQKFLFELKNRQTLFLLFYGEVAGLEIFSRLWLNGGNLFSQLG